MTFGSLYAHKRHVSVSTPSLPPRADYEPFATERRHVARWKFVGFSARELRTIAEMRRSGFGWRQIGERLGYSRKTLCDAYASLPKHLQ